MVKKKKLKEIKAQCAEENCPPSLGLQPLISPPHRQSVLVLVLPPTGILYTYK